mmetsp:Transcript_47881/g.119788  ORF Transcript_47881/g.119788 Transcript_47881/m.119788 type:complete len:271 (+) Transcript_47881:496-1308(+)
MGHRPEQGHRRRQQEPGHGPRPGTHAGAGLPDQERVRAVRQVRTGPQDRRVLWRRADRAAQDHPEGRQQAAAHPDRHSRADQPADSREAPQRGPPQVLRVGRVRQVPGQAGHAQGRAEHLHRDPAGEAGHDVQRHPQGRHPGRLPQVHAQPGRDLHRRREQADAARPAAVLRAADREREEQEAQRPARQPRVQPGHHLRQERLARQGTQQAPHRVQLPLHRHTLRHEAGGAHQEVHRVQEIRETHPRLDRPHGSRHRHRARQHRGQLRHA